MYLWRRLYEAAISEDDPQILRRRIEVARRAMQSQIMELHNADEAGELWELMDALRSLADLLKKSELSRPNSSTENHKKQVPLQGSQRYR
jgi:undecaprenyl pyrophosphate synthase